MPPKWNPWYATAVHVAETQPKFSSAMGSDDPMASSTQLRRSTSDTNSATFSAVGQQRCATVGRDFWLAVFGLFFVTLRHAARPKISSLNGLLSFLDCWTVACASFAQLTLARYKKTRLGQTTSHLVQTRRQVKRSPDQLDILYGAVGNVNLMTNNRLSCVISYYWPLTSVVPNETITTWWTWEQLTICAVGDFNDAIRCANILTGTEKLAASHWNCAPCLFYLQCYICQVVGYVTLSRDLYRMKLKRETCDILSTD